MLCLGIETSCDESALAFVNDGVLLAEAIYSQADLHALFGGVVPELASREHCRVIGPLYDSLLAKLGSGFAAKPDCIAVARGPGLLGSLLIGVAFAKSLGLALNVPVIGINHLHAHLLAVGLEQPLVFPSLGLLASGGHTNLYRIDGPTEFTLLGRTIDDAAGEAFDKFGKAAGFAYPAGQRIDLLASKGIVERKLFPYPYTDNDNLDFSFSGLKTAASSYLAANKNLLPPIDADIVSGFGKEFLERSLDVAEQKLANVCASFNHAVAHTLRIKTERALKQQGHVIKAITLAGGVAANSAVRAALTSLSQAAGLPFIVPGFSLCTDNAAMIAYSGYLLMQKGLRHPLNFPAIPRGRIVPDDYLRV